MASPVLLDPNIQQVVQSAVAATATVSVRLLNELDIRRGGQRIRLTVTGTTWVAIDDTIRQAIIDGLDADATRLHGWNNEVRDSIATSTVVRTSGTLVTITLPELANYDIASGLIETITVTIPSTAVDAGVALAAGTFTVSAIPEVIAPRLYLHDGAGRRIGNQPAYSFVTGRGYHAGRIDHARFGFAALLADGRPDPALGSLRRGPIYVVIESEAYPVPWVGFLTDITPDPDSGVIDGQARSLEGLLAARLLPESFSVTGDSAQSVRHVLNEVNRRNPTGIIADEDMEAGEPFTASFGNWTAGAALDRIARETRRRWWIEHEVSPAGIVSRLFYGTPGFDLAGDVWLTEGAAGNIIPEPSNIDLMGDPQLLRALGSTGGIEERRRTATRVPAVLRSDEEALYHGYHLRRSAAGGESPIASFERLAVLTHRSAQLEAAVEALLADPERGAEVVTVRLKGREDDVPYWQRVRVGDIVRLFLMPTSYLEGYDGPASVLGVDPHEPEGYLRLALVLLDEGRAVPAEASAWDLAVLARNPAGYWPLSHRAGNMLDLSANGNDGTVTLGAGRRDAEPLIAGADDRSMDFDGADTNVQVTDVAVLQNLWDGGGALEFVIQPRSDGESSFGHIVWKGWRAFVQFEAGGVMAVEFNMPHSTTEGQWGTTALLVANDRPSHVLITYDADAVGNDPAIYVDGVSAAITENQAPVGTRTTDVANNLHLGNNSASLATFDGLIAKVALYGAIPSDAAAWARQRYQALIGRNV